MKTQQQNQVKLLHSILFLNLLVLAVCSCSALLLCCIYILRFCCRSTGVPVTESLFILQFHDTYSVTATPSHLIKTNKLFSFCCGVVCLFVCFPQEKYRN